MILEGLLLQLVDILVNAQAGLFGIGFNLLALPGLELLRGHAAFLGFLRDLLLHGGDLLRRWLLIGGWRSGHFGWGMPPEMEVAEVTAMLFLREMIGNEFNDIRGDRLLVRLAFVFVLYPPDQYEYEYKSLQR